MAFLQSFISQQLLVFFQNIWIQCRFDWLCLWSNRSLLLEEIYWTNIWNLTKNVNPVERYFLDQGDLHNFNHICESTRKKMGSFAIFAAVNSNTSAILKSIDKQNVENRKRNWKILKWRIWDSLLKTQKRKYLSKILHLYFLLFKIRNSHWSVILRMSDF